MDLTVLATPFYYGSMLAEHRWLSRHRDEPAFDSGQFERRDTIANLTMAHASVVAPLLSKQFRRHLELGRGRWARPMLAVAATATAVATAADVIARRRRASTPLPATPAATASTFTPATTSSNGSAPSGAPTSPSGPTTERLERVAGIAAATAIATGGIVVTSTLAARSAAPRLWERRRLDLGTGVAGWAAAIVGWDLIYYWNHRFMHQSRFLWAVHVVHHSSERYNLSVALRQPVADSLGVFVPYGLLSWLGVRPSMIETARAVNLLYQYWVHTETIPKMGRFEQQMNTPSHHRVHHGSNPQYLDRNHGGILISWDKAFGTFEPEEEPVVYGLTKNLHTFSPISIAFREYRDIFRDIVGSRTWRDRLSFVFRGPGWADDRHRESAEAAELAAA